MRFRRAAVLSATALLLAACSGGGSGSDAAASSSESGSELSRMSAQEVFDASFAALEDAGAAHVKGSLTEDGQETGMDLQLQDDDAIGSVTLEGSTLQFVFLDGVPYIQGTADFWTSSGIPAEFAAQLDGAWVMMPKEAAADFSGLTLSGLVDALTDSGRATVDGTVTTDELDGDPVVVVTQSDGSRLTVADDDPSYPLVVEDKGDAPGSLTFSRFGEREDITAPADALNLDDLGA
jgi:hypothetical protein